VRRFRLDQDDKLKLAIISIDPSRKRTGGALLGDRIRMNAIEHPNIFMRSLATRDTGKEVSAALPEVIAATRLAGFDMIIVETSGIGQGDAAIVPFVDVSLYVMTPEFGAASQLEKIDMLDFADFVAINKFDRKGAEDALRDVRKQYQRNRELFTTNTDEMPVFGTMAARFNDDGVTALFQALAPALAAKGLKLGKPSCRWWRQGLQPRPRHRAGRAHPLPGRDRRGGARLPQAHREQARIARERQALRISRSSLKAATRTRRFDELIDWKDGELTGTSKKLLDMWPKTVELYAADEYVVKIRDKEIRTKLTSESLSGSKIRKVACRIRGRRRDPALPDEGERPGSFPYTAGVFAFKREGEDPTRMFAGEGDAFRTNRRFKRSPRACRRTASTAFDSVTLYGCDPDPRPDIYGKIGNSGVSSPPSTT
jgi:methylmalonyl-CoA mutase